MEILALELPTTSTPALAALLEQARKETTRVLETIELTRLNCTDLWKLLTVVAKMLRFKEAPIRIGQVGDGFPHYVHLIGECLFGRCSTT